MLSSRHFLNLDFKLGKFERSLEQRRVATRVRHYLAIFQFDYAIAHVIEAVIMADDNDRFAAGFQIGQQLMIEHFLE